MTTRKSKHFPAESLEGVVPLLDVAGSASTCGEMLGCAWHAALAQMAQNYPSVSRPAWKAAAFRKLIGRYAPHLPDLFLGMAKGAGLPEDRIGTRALPEKEAGCTSFAVAPEAALEGRPISGQTKDTPADRIFQYQVLRMRLTDGPSALTLTYPGWIFGHGFVAGGCAIFRNSLYAGASRGRLSYAMWGILALHCPTVEEAVELALRHGVETTGAHCTLADERGGIRGIEMGRGGIRILKPARGIYVHSNHVVSGASIGRFEEYNAAGLRDSTNRRQRLTARLAAEHGRLTAPLAHLAMADHGGYPHGVCHHAAGLPGAQRQVASAFAPLLVNTTAAVTAEPARGRLHVTRGQPCRNWPQTYSL